MIEITVIKNSSELCGFSFSGHAGAGSKGSDPVCAAVSTIVSVLVTGLEKVCRAEADIFEDPAENCVKITVNSPDERTTAVLETIYESVILLSSMYARWILVKEVDNGIRFKCS